MNNELTEMAFVLDRSGSMADRVSDVIGGFNGLIEKQKREPGKATVTLSLFDTNHDLLYSGADINLVAPLTPATYYARGGTALFDAVARTIDLVGNRLRATPESRRPGKVIVTVMTDGEENSSVEYGAGHGGAARLREKIEIQKNQYNWQVLFVGANMDAVLAGAGLGIMRGQAINWDSSAAGVAGTFAVMSNYMSSYRIVDDASEAKSLSFVETDRDVAMGLDQTIQGQPPAQKP
jgi:hypothetical protein